MDSNLLTELQPHFFGEIREDEPLRFHTGFRMGGPTRYMLIPNGMEDLRRTIVWIGKHNIPYHVMGNGNSVLAHPDGYDGVVIKLVQVLNHIRIEGNKIYAGAGATVSALLRQAVSRGSTGLTRWWGTSSSIGGWLTRVGLAEYPNLDRIIDEVYVMEADGSITRWIEPSQIFSQGYPQGRVIVEVVFRLHPGRSKEQEEKIQTRQREWEFLTQTNLPMAGPVFLPTQADLTEAFVKAKVSGLRRGHAAFLGIWNGYVANLGGATYNELTELIEEVKDRMKKERRVSLRDGLCRLKTKEVIRC